MDLLGLDVLNAKKSWVFGIEGDIILCFPKEVTDMRLAVDILILCTGLHTVKENNMKSKKKKIDSLQRNLIKIKMAKLKKRKKGKKLKKIN